MTHTQSTVSFDVFYIDQSETITGTSASFHCSDPRKWETPISAKYLAYVILKAFPRVQSSRWVIGNVVLLRKIYTSRFRAAIF